MHNEIDRVKEIIRFLLVGGFVGVMTLLFRESFGFVLGDSDLWRYGSTIVLAYAIGVVTAYYLHGRLTFRTRQRRTPKTMFRFIAVSIVCAIAAALFSAAIRNYLLIDWLYKPWSSSFAFALGSIGAAIVSYLLMKVYVFPETKQSANAA